MLEVVYDSEFYVYPRAWRPFNGGFCVSWLGVLVWLGRRER